ncbi:MAG TPA: hypothetical protein EYN38_02850 [Flavobacteriales bacterium]|nr:hypothetical protein [Flavobacteriales bacterium]
MGQQRSSWTHWHESGKIQYTGNYLDGLQSGMWISWYDCPEACNTETGISAILFGCGSDEGR